MRVASIRASIRRPRVTAGLLHLARGAQCPHTWPRAADRCRYSRRAASPGLTRPEQPADDGQVYATADGDTRGSVGRCVPNAAGAGALTQAQLPPAFASHQTSNQRDNIHAKKRAVFGDTEGRLNLADAGPNSVSPRCEGARRRLDRLRPSLVARSMLGGAGATLRRIGVDERHLFREMTGNKREGRTALQLPFASQGRRRPGMLPSR